MPAVEVRVGGGMGIYVALGYQSVYLAINKTP